MKNVNPYYIEGPAIISVSGGRTSGFMLRQIMDAHGGKLPSDVIPVFCNTGLEHEATYQFLHEIEQRWTPIVWLEYRHTPEAERRHSYVEVKYCTASRDGTPFTQVIKAKNVLPNVFQRFCTSELKLRTKVRFVKQKLGWDEWTNVIGLRYDEPRRAHKIKGESGEEAICPIYHARHTIDDVLAFWSSQPFDLKLPGNDNAYGNCQLCFLKGTHKLAKVVQTNPDAAKWWIEQEERQDIQATGHGHLFRIDRPTYRQMLTQITVQGRMFDDAIEDDTIPCACTD